MYLNFSLKRERLMVNDCFLAKTINFLFQPISSIELNQPRETITRGLYNKTFYGRN